MAATDRSRSGRRYLILLATVVVAAVSLTLWGRSSMSRTHPSAGTEMAPAPALELSFRIDENGVMTPQAAEVETGTRVAITLTNHSGKAIRVELPAYGDRLRLGPLESGASWRGEFTADRPGEDLAWTIDGRPSAKFVVKGSHLIEGHR